MTGSELANVKAGEVLQNAKGRRVKAMCDATVTATGKVSALVHRLNKDGQAYGVAVCLNMFTCREWTVAK